MVRVKVCGITNREDALKISKMGVDAIGFILSSKSQRMVSLSKVSEIVKILPPFLSRVAVVVDPTIEQLNEIENSKFFDYIQFHGSESIDLIKRSKLKTIKAIKIENEQSLKAISTYEEDVDYFLFDTKVGEKVGGTGKTFDWGFLKQINLQKPFILAGGIGPNNVIEAIKEVKPDAIDLNSKVEEKPGKKDIKLIKEVLSKIKREE
ncbi:phosphoribosylanthranilate isomerase [Petrotoga sp. 9PW.55.5.1]|uniref:phosphoribosylanthranilate isomerase n=1 Tax=Petrotoga sp. 9PW.55.5.1 TaxID=1308979 RepID=UPI000DC3DAAC|nr:phosphoribosylanthranilate isomerase [Petrotoga sp. 9PW.55.5.1]RAO98813.1 phosphoribosylanthranilate isomerase [Petrotoga sp. 9PW.55.5.1]